MDTHEWLRFLERAVEQSSDGIAIVDSDQKVVYMNHAWMMIHGYEASDYKSLQGQYLGVFHTPEQLEQEVVPTLKIAMVKGFHQAEIGHKRKNSSIFSTLMTATIVRDEKGKIIGYIGTAQDITEQKRIQETLAKERKIFNEVIEHNPFAIVIYNAEGYVIKGNKACLELFGAQPPRTYSIFQDPLITELGLMDQLQQVKQGKIVKVNEIKYNPHHVYPQATDKTLILNVSAFPIFDGKGNLNNIIFVFDDITEQKRAEEELAKKDLEVQFSSVISMISSIFIHDSMKIDENILNSFKTLGFTIDCDIITILQYQPDPTADSPFKTKWCWTPKERSWDNSQLVELLSKPYLEEYWDHPPQNLFLKIQYQPKKRMKQSQKNMLDLNSLLFVPIYQGKNRFGVMILNRGNGKPDFTMREISLSLQISILTGLALKNESLYYKI